MPTAPWTDKTVMPWGVHKGKTLRELEPSYLLWLFEQTWIKDWPGLYLYLKAHENQLMEEKREKEGDPEDDAGFSSYDDYKNHRN